MKNKVLSLLFVFAFIFSLSVAVSYAGDDKKAATQNKEVKVDAEKAGCGSESATETKSAEKSSKKDCSKKCDDK